MLYVQQFTCTVIAYSICIYIYMETKSKLQINLFHQQDYFYTVSLLDFVDIVLIPTGVRTYIII